MLSGMKKVMLPNPFWATLLVWLSPFLLFAQVNTQEKEKALQNQQNNAIPTVKKKQAPAVEPGVADGAVAGTMSEAGYLAVYQKLRKEALAANRYHIAPAKQAQLNQVVEKLGEMNARSFEYHYASYLNARFDTAAGHHLLEAYRLAPANKELLPELTLFFEAKGEPAQQLRYCKLIQQQNLYDPYLYAYARNLLKSVEPGAFLITRGEWDTQPLWVLQKVQGIRTDVTILQMELLHQERYFNRAMAPFKLKKGAYKRFTTDKGAFFRELAEAGEKKPVYLSVTVEKQLLGKAAEHLYTTGLAMKLTTMPYDNLPVLKVNWSSFDQSALVPATLNPDLNRMAANYLLPMGLLYQHELSEGNRAGAEKLKQQMTTLAQKAGKTEELNRFLKAPPKK